MAMARPMDIAWSVLKADFFLGDERSSRGIMSANYNSPMYEGTPAFGNLNVISSSERYSPLNMHYGTGRSMASAGMRENFPNMAAAKVVTSPSREPYYRGGSIPRLNPDGTFDGVNLQNTLNSSGIDTFDQFAQLVGGIAGHETVHRLIDPEMVEWAKQQSGIMDLKPYDAKLAYRLENDAAFRAQMEDELGPYAVDEMLGEHDRQMAEHAFNTLRSMGHETGAYALTPAMTQEEINNIMLASQFGPYIDRQDPSPMSELHLAGPSADQLRYEQLLQEQNLAE